MEVPVATDEFAPRPPHFNDSILPPGSAPPTLPAPDYEASRDVNELLQEYTLDSGGFLSCTDLAEILKDIDLRPEVAATLLAILDKDRTGLVAYSDFVDFIWSFGMESSFCHSAKMNQQDTSLTAVNEEEELWEDVPSMLLFKTLPEDPNTDDYDDDADLKAAAGDALCAALLCPAEVCEEDDYALRQMALDGLISAAGDGSLKATLAKYEGLGNATEADIEMLKHRGRVALESAFGEVEVDDEVEENDEIDVKHQARAALEIALDNARDDDVTMLKEQARAALERALEDVDEYAESDTKDRARVLLELAVGKAAQGDVVTVKERARAALESALGTVEEDDEVEEGDETETKDLARAALEIALDKSEDQDLESLKQRSRAALEAALEEVEEDDDAELKEQARKALEDALGENHDVDELGIKDQARAALEIALNKFEEDEVESLREKARVALRNVYPEADDSEEALFKEPARSFLARSALESALEDVDEDGEAQTKDQARAALETALCKSALEEEDESELKEQAAIALENALGEIHDVDDLAVKEQARAALEIALHGSQDDLNLPRDTGIAPIPPPLEESFSPVPPSAEEHHVISPPDSPPPKLYMPDADVVRNVKALMSEVVEVDGGAMSSDDLAEVLVELGLTAESVAVLFACFIEANPGSAQFSDFIDWVWAPGVDTARRLSKTSAVSDVCEDECEHNVDDMMERARAAVEIAFDDDRGLRCVPEDAASVCRSGSITTEVAEHSWNESASIMGTLFMGAMDDRSQI